MFNAGNNKATDQEMERLLELSTDPEFLSQLDSFKENKAAEIKTLHASHAGLGSCVAESCRRRPSGTLGVSNARPLLGRAREGARLVPRVEYTTSCTFEGSERSLELST